MQKPNINREINELTHDIIELSNFRQCLTGELKKEINLKNEI